MNAMIPGKKVDAVFGFCDIRNFTDATEVLNDKVMVFVNQVRAAGEGISRVCKCIQIGKIVHGIVDEFHGAANKNIGDAFLVRKLVVVTEKRFAIQLVWRLPENDAELRKKMCDMAVISFVKVSWEKCTWSTRCMCW